MKLAIMQPYFIPYLGYYHLLTSVDLFVVYDDIKYTKGSWINRNRLLFGSSVCYVTVPLSKDSDALPVNARVISPEWPRRNAGYLRRIDQHYRTRANYAAARALYAEITGHPRDNLFDFLDHSLRTTARHLGIGTEIVRSSAVGDFSRLRGADKVKAICHALGATRYVNPVGGMALYDRVDFAAAGIELSFVRSRLPPYDQGEVGFVPGLSIIDLLMSVGEGEALDTQLRAFHLA